MENKMKRLKEAIKSNKDFSFDFKNNVMSLTDAMVATLPEYDYRNFERVLSTIGLRYEYEIDEYSKYDSKTNVLLLNMKKIIEDGIDVQHLFMSKIMSIATFKEEKDDSLKAFNDGMTERITSLFVADIGVKKINVLEQLAVSTFSEVVDPQVLLDSYMRDDISLILNDLESHGIGESEFRYLLRDLNFMQKKDVPANEGFATAEKRMVYMYGKKIQTKVNDKELDRVGIKESFEDFDASLVHTKEELCVLYNDNNFRHVSGIKWISATVRMIRDKVYDKYDMDMEEVKQVK